MQVWCFDVPVGDNWVDGAVHARTKSEARAEVKKLLSRRSEVIRDLGFGVCGVSRVRYDRLPVGSIVCKVRPEASQLKAR